MGEELPKHLTVENTNRIGRFCRIYLDGTEVKDVTEAHTGEGWLIRYYRDPAGKLIRAGDCFATERLTGVVTVRLDAEHSTHG
jgi:YD repeat-containing protein